eukprot:1161672-Pelagomonas_calceolata.AAC.1
MVHFDEEALALHQNLATTSPIPEEAKGIVKGPVCSLFLQWCQELLGTRCRGRPLALILQNCWQSPLVGCSPRFVCFQFSFFCPSEMTNP